MARKSSSKSKVVAESEEPKGWSQVASFLGEPVLVVQRWAAEGMPLRRQGRFVATTKKELNDWMGSGIRQASARRYWKYRPHL